MLIPAYRSLLSSRYTGPLDTAGTDVAAGAYSVARLLTYKYAGAILRIRRSSDNAELDINAKADGTIDTGAINTFIGAGSGFIVKLYDQTGNGRHMVQSTAAQQPSYVASGLNSKPTGRFAGAQYLSTPTIRSSVAGADAYVVSQRSGSQLGGSLFQRILVSWDGTGNDFTAPNWLIVGPWDGSGNSIAYTRDIRRGGGTNVSIVSPVIGYASQNILYFSGDISEAVIWATRMGTDAYTNGVKANATTFYGL